MRATALQPETVLKGTTITNVTEKGSTNEKTSKPWKDINDAVTFYLAKDIMPIDICTTSL